MKKNILYILTLLSVTSIYSQEDEQLLVSELKQSTIITQPSTLNKGFFKLGTSLAFGVADKLFLENGSKEFVYENSWAKSGTYSVIMQYGITNRLEFSLDIPYERSSMFFSSITEIPAYKSVTSEGFKLKGDGIGDISLGINFQLIKGSMIKPSLVTRITATIPTGEKNPTNIKNDFEYDLPSGYGETTISFDQVYRKITYPFSYSLYYSLKFSLGGEKMMRSYEEAVKFNSGMFVQIGASYNFMLNDWIAVQNDLFYINRQAEKYEGITDAAPGISSNGVEYMPNINFQFKKFRFVEGVIIPLMGKNISADPQYILVAQYIF